MKKYFRQLILLLIVFSVLLFSCQKEIGKEPIQQEEISTSANRTHGHLKQTKAYSSEVVQKWLDLKYRFLRTVQEVNTPNGLFIPGFYSALGISLYESVVPGMPAFKSLSGQLIDMPTMPATDPGLAYHWAASANAALAQTFRNFLPNTSVQNKAAIDSLEKALNDDYMKDVNLEIFQRSAAFGKSVANQIFEWRKTDGSYAIYPPYIPPVGMGMWVPTPPAFAPPIAVIVQFYRPLIPGVMDANAPPPPIQYSTIPGSDFYNSMVEVYNTTQLLSLNPVLKAQANYWRGTQGGSGFILWYAILRKLLIEEGDNVMLDKAAIAYCKIGIVHQDATIALIKARYFHNELAPITYIRNVLGHATWNAEFPTVPMPCYPEFHGAQNSSSAAVLTQVFGSNYQFNTNDIHPMGMPGYTFNSFAEAAENGNQSRFLAGICTQYAVYAGAWIGNKTAEYLNNKIKFLK